MDVSAQFENVTVIKKANVYFAGKCISHTIIFADGTRKSVGIIFPSLLTFDTSASEIMELNSGKCKIRLHGDVDWSRYEAGDCFTIPAHARFDIETTELIDYVCHYV